ncbi:ladderlectin-like isoform X1 [Esox lucius]|uniref:ladderlectin-like isoform X1 n=1 Tax=Esox lucius TaxID=8010 RepID=UPI0014771E05|nr:ladderlectin-like isoform X1 [Esox lucius]XP_034146205.1 ladderlectin-like isoform X1 [Esox lucius]
MAGLIIFLLLSAAFSLGDPQWWPHRCPGEWRQFGSHCVIFDETPRSWADAEFHCQSLGGHLASVHNWLESRFLESLTSGFPLTWIGGTDGGQPEMTPVPRHTGHKSWSWTDGSGFNYRQWAEGMPNNSIAGESCIQMNFGDKHRWNNEVCEKHFASVCSQSD